MKYFDEILQQEVSMQEEVIPEYGREIIHEEIRPQIEVEEADIDED